MKTRTILTAGFIALTLIACGETNQETDSVALEVKEVSKKSSPAPAAAKQRVGFEGVADLDNHMGSGGGLSGHSRSVVRQEKGRTTRVLNPVVKETFFADAHYAKERYLAYTINLKFISDSMALSRDVLLKTIELYGYPVSSSLRQEQNHLVQRAHIKVKTDSLFVALEILKNAGVLVEETTNVVDYTNHVKITNAPVYTADQSTRKKDETPRVRDVNKIHELPIKDKVEWADITLSIEGTEAVVIYEKEESSLLSEAILSVQNKLLHLLAFVVENLLVFVVIISVMMVGKRIVKQHAQKNEA